MWTESLSVRGRGSTCAVCVLLVVWAVVFGSVGMARAAGLGPVFQAGFW